MTKASEANLDKVRHSKWAIMLRFCKLKLWSLNFIEFKKTLDLHPEENTTPNAQEWIQQNFRAPLKNFCPML